MYESADEMGLFDDRLNLAIDEIPWRFYGDTDTYGVGNVDHARGTSYAYKLLTICIVGDDGERFTLDWTIVTGREETREVIGELVDTASNWCDIKNIFLDRGFYGVLMIKALQATGENFMMRAPKSPKRTRLLNEHGSDIVVEEDDEMARSRPPYEKTTINRIIVPARESAQDDYIEFVTNRTVTEESAVNLARTYEQRWGVETSYRKIKQFLPKTTSTHYSLRLFYLLFAILLYNTWIMVNSIVRESLGIPRGESPPVTRGMFAIVLIGLREGIT